MTLPSHPPIIWQYNRFKLILFYRANRVRTGDKLTAIRWLSLSEVCFPEYRTSQWVIKQAEIREKFVSFISTLCFDSKIIYSPIIIHRYRPHADVGNLTKHVRGILRFSWLASSSTVICRKYERDVTWPSVFDDFRWRRKVDINSNYVWFVPLRSNHVMPDAVRLRISTPRAIRRGIVLTSCAGNWFTDHNDQTVYNNSSFFFNSSVSITG